MTPGRQGTCGAANPAQGKAAWLEEGILDPFEGTGPWIAGWASGAGETGNVHRRYR